MKKLMNVILIGVSVLLGMGEVGAMNLIKRIRKPSLNYLSGKREESPGVKDVREESPGVKDVEATSIPRHAQEALKSLKIKDFGTRFTSDKQKPYVPSKKQVKFLPGAIKLDKNNGVSIQLPSLEAYSTFNQLESKFNSLKRNKHNIGADDYFDGLIAIQDELNDLYQNKDVDSYLLDKIQALTEQIDDQQDLLLKKEKEKAVKEEKRIAREKEEEATNTFNQLQSKFNNLKVFKRTMGAEDYLDGLIDIKDQLNNLYQNKDVDSNLLNNIQALTKQVDDEQDLLLKKEKEKAVKEEKRIAREKEEEEKRITKQKEEEEKTIARELEEEKERVTREEKRIAREAIRAKIDEEEAKNRARFQESIAGTKAVFKEKRESRAREKEIGGQDILSLPNIGKLERSILRSKKIQNVQNISEEEDYSYLGVKIGAEKSYHNFIIVDQVPSGSGNRLARINQLSDDTFKINPYKETYLRSIEFFIERDDISLKLHHFIVDKDSNIDSVVWAIAEKVKVARWVFGINHLSGTKKFEDSNIASEIVAKLLNKESNFKFAGGAVLVEGMGKTPRSLINGSQLKLVNGLYILRNNPLFNQKVVPFKNFKGKAIPFHIATLMDAERNSDGRLDVKPLSNDRFEKLYSKYLYTVIWKLLRLPSYYMQYNMMFDGFLMSELGSSTSYLYAVQRVKDSENTFYAQPKEDDLYEKYFIELDNSESTRWYSDKNPSFPQWIDVNLKDISKMIEEGKLFNW